MVIRKFVLLQGFALALSAGAVISVLPATALPSGAAAAAQGEGARHGNEGGQGMRQGQGQGQKGNGAAGQGGGSPLEDEVMRGGRGGPSTEADEDSDRPDWAGTPGREGKPGRGNQTPGVSKGDSYGDLWAILRDDDGEPVLDENGNVQPCLNADCSETAQLTEDGELPEEYADQVMEVEFGRLNVTRAPSTVLDHSLTEALAKVDGLTITADNLAEVTDEAGRLIDLFGNTIDSPLENLALYRALLEATASDATGGFYTLSVVTQDEGGGSSTLTLNVAADVLPTLAASAIAAGSDKTGTLSVDEVVYISGFLGVDDELTGLVSGVTYDRDALFDRQVTVLVYDEDRDVYVPTTVNLLEAVEFNTVPEIDADGNGIDTFTQNADDAVQVLEYVHDNALEE